MPRPTNPPDHPEKQRLPNIILFIPDQWRGKDAGCLGNPVIRTPHTDLLAEEGLAFANCFAQSTVCTPSRCSFMTGWYPHIRGHRTMHHMLSPDEPFLLKQLKDQGYYVWWGGKNDVVRVEEEESVCSLRFRPGHSTEADLKPPALNPGHRLFYSHYRGKIGDQPIWSGDDALVDGAVRFLENTPPEPFCICLTLHDPHVPFQVDEPYFSMYDRSGLPPIIPRPEDGTKSRHMTLIRERMNLHALGEDDMREILAVYYGMITRTDAALGRLMTALKASGHWDDSAVFVFSDHGEYAGDYHMVEKSQNGFEDDLTKVPLIVKYPSWIPVAERKQPVAELVELIDVYATVAELARLKQRHTHFGRSLIPVSTGQAEQHREQVFCEGGALVSEPHTHEPPVNRERVYWPRLSAQNDDRESHGKGVMVRTKEWKFVKRLYEGDELYDLVADSDELRNLAGDPQYASIRNDILNRIALWYMETADVVPYEPVMHKLEGRL